MISAADHFATIYVRETRSSLTLKNTYWQCSIFCKQRVFVLQQTLFSIL